GDRHLCHRFGPVQATSSRIAWNGWPWAVSRRYGPEGEEISVVLQRCCSLVLAWTSIAQPPQHCSSDLPEGRLGTAHRSDDPPRTHPRHPLLCRVMSQTARAATWHWRPSLPL